MEINAPTIIRFFIITLVVGIVVGFAYFNSRALLYGPQIEVFHPEQGSSFEHSTIEVSGKAQYATVLTLNGREITIDEEGIFREQLVLMEGYTIIDIGAKDRFGREKTERIHVAFIPQTPSFPSPSLENLEETGSNETLQEDILFEEGGMREENF